jgi:hypothetical protein
VLGLVHAVVAAPDDHGAFVALVSLATVDPRLLLSIRRGLGVGRGAAAAERARAAPARTPW